MPQKTIMKYLTFDIYNGAGTVSAESSLFDNKEFNDKGVFLKVNELIIGNDLTVLSFIGKTRRQQILL